MFPSWLRSAARSLGHGLLHLIYPGLCHVCARSLEPPAPPFCADCRRALTLDDAAVCPRCAATVGPFVADASGCVRCREESFAFDAAVRLGPYEGLLRETVLRLKRWSGETLAERLGALFAETARERLLGLGAELVLAVPLHWRRLWSRGYNQAAALAHGLAGVLGLPCRPTWLRRIRHTPRQTDLTPAQRRLSVRGAFRTTTGAGVAGKVVLLVDDVVTTGTTVGEAAKALRQAGAARVVVAAVARAQG
jgi:ComF family protein